MQNIEYNENKEIKENLKKKKVSKSEEEDALFFTTIEENSQSSQPKIATIENRVNQSKNLIID
jgi:hypothetical protein